MHCLPRDFVATADGLIFAVVAEGIEEGRVLGSLRYVPAEARLCKLNTQQADAYLHRHYPEFLFHSATRDAPLHGVPLGRVARHYRPRDRVRELLDEDRLRDSFEDRAVRLLRMLAEAGLPVDRLGVTGSLLVGAHTAASDIDVVLYDGPTFQFARRVLSDLIRRSALESLGEAAWRATYERRGCSLTFDEYVWHERRKGNKAIFEGTKVDFGLVTPDREAGNLPWRKCGEARIRARVLDDRHGFDYPSRWPIAHDRVDEVVSFTATFTGQAQAGEWIEAAGLLEVAAGGRRRRLVVGTSREAVGQFIRVVGQAEANGARARH